MTLSVVGQMTDKGIVVKDAPEFRKSVAGDIVECGGKYWLVVNPHGTGNVDITADFIRVSVMADLMVERDLQNTYDSFSRENA